MEDSKMALEEIVSRLENRFKVVTKAEIEYGKTNDYDMGIVRGELNIIKEVFEIIAKTREATK